MNVLEVLIRTIMAFIILLILTRILGKKQVSELTFFNYVTGITFGSIAAMIAVDRRISAAEGIVGLIVWTILTMLVGYIGLKVPRARVLLDGEPTIIIKKGKILEKTMRDAHYNMDDLSMMLREKGFFSIEEIEYAILEPDGQLSVLKKPVYQTPINKDINIATKPFRYVPTELIVDGEIVYKNLKDLNLDVAWLDEQIRKTGLHSLEEVFYAELQSDGTVYIDKRKDALY
ncbi:YetF domain-containing protein [Aneurinibacillus sp. REN35]|uniref:YetF domain-containing protein n=1 Tax=Aneurinibacillus sp. REN35 TaxID=3237286 RepID=UPI003526FBB5